MHLENVTSSSRNDVVQAKVHGANIEDQVNDPMEEDDHANNTIEDDGTNTLIQDTFSAGMDDDHDEFNDVHDISLLEREIQSLYEGSKITLLSDILLLVNLKVFNGFSNTCVTKILKYLIYFVTYT